MEPLLEQAKFRLQCYVEVGECGVHEIKGQSHLWYRVEFVLDEVHVMDMEGISEKGGEIMPVDDLPDWMKERVALIKLAGAEGVVSGEEDVIGGRVGDVFYIRKDRSE